MLGNRRKKKKKTISSSWLLDGTTDPTQSNKASSSLVAGLPPRRGFRCPRFTTLSILWSWHLKKHWKCQNSGSQSSPASEVAEELLKICFLHLTLEILIQLVWDGAQTLLISKSTSVYSNVEPRLKTPGLTTAPQTCNSVSLLTASIKKMRNSLLLFFAIIIFFDIIVLWYDRTVPISSLFEITAMQSPL